MIVNETDMDLDTFLESLMKPEYIPKFPYSLFYSEGSKYFQKRLYKKAVERLDEAILTDPTNVQALLTRAKVHICLQQYEKAKEDATEALVISPEYSEAFDVMGRAEYLMGDFEGAYLTYLAGREIRPDIEKLRLGQQLCEESMRNSMKSSSGLQIDKGDIHLMSKANNDEARFARNSRHRLPTFERFSKDKSILKKLLSDPDVKNVHGLCEESLAYIHQSERFWAMQKPLCSRKKVQAARKRIIKKGTILELIKSMKNRCMEYLRSDNIKLCLADGKKLARLMESRFEEPTEQNIKLTADIYHILSLACKAKRDDDQRLKFLKKQLEISQKSKLMYPQIRASHHLGMYYLMKGEYANACSCFRYVADALEPRKLKTYFEERQGYMSEEEILEENNHDLSDIDIAKTWVWKLKRNSITLRPPSTVCDLLHELLQKDITLLNLGLFEYKSKENDVYKSIILDDSESDRHNEAKSKIIEDSSFILQNDSESDEKSSSGSVKQDYSESVQRNDSDSFAQNESNSIGQNECDSITQDDNESIGTEKYFTAEDRMSEFSNDSDGR